MQSRIEYLEWITGRPERASYDLGSSDLRWDTNDPLQPAILPEDSEVETDVTVQEQVAEHYDVSPECVLITAGASHANMLAFAAGLEGEQKRVLVERPGYEPLHRTPELFGACIDRFNRPPDTEFAIEADRVAKRLESDTVLAVVTNRHNPSGRLVEEDTLAELADIMVDNDSRLLVDEVYAPFGGEPSGGRVFGGPTAAGLDGVVITGSLTKFHGLGGLRIGWLIADKPFIERAQSVFYHAPTVAEPSLELGRRALAKTPEISAQAQSRIATNADRLHSFISKRDDLSGPVFDGSSFAFLRHEHGDGDQISEIAWSEGVLVVPGRFFDDKTRFRLSLSGSPDTMADAIDTLGTALDTY